MALLEILQSAYVEIWMAKDMGMVYVHLVGGYMKPSKGDLGQLRVSIDYNEGDSMAHHREHVALVGGKGPTNLECIQSPVHN